MNAAEPLRVSGARAPTAVAGALLVASAGLTAVAPVPVLLVAPILLGVPHLLGDLWVLFLRPAAARSVARWVGGPVVALLGLRLLSAVGVGYPPWLEILVGTAGVLLGAASTRSATRIGIAAVACAPAWVFASQAALLLGHVHNAVAVGLLILWGPRRFGIGVAVFSAAVYAALLGGAADGALTPFAGLAPTALAKALAPGIADPWAARLVTAFCFAQLVHYLCWIGLLPVLLRDTPGNPRPLSTALRADLGLPLLLLGVLGSIALPIAAAWDPARVRSTYLSIVVFHGWMELAVLAAWRRTPAGT